MAKRNMRKNTPVGLMNGVFRKLSSGDLQWLMHCIFFSAQDLDANSDLFNHKDPENVYKANKDDLFVLDASQKGGLVKYANSTCVVDEVNVKLYRVLMDGQWNCEYWTTKYVQKGDLILSDYELDINNSEQDRINYDNLNENEIEKMKRFTKFRNCKCFKYGIKDCVNATKNEIERIRIERKARKGSKTAQQNKSKSRSRSRSRTRNKSDN